MSYVRVGIVGVAAGGESWSVNPVFDPSFEFPGGVSQSALDAAALAIANLSPGATNTSFMSPSFTLTACRLEVRDDATDALIGLSQQGRTVPLVGTTTLRMPYQSAVVYSLRTDTPGPSGRGRLYWPAPGASLTTSARLATVDQTAALSQFVGYLDQMRDALATAFPTIGFDLAVRSKTTKTTPHVTRVQLGDIIDTQRRRRDKLIEAYQSLSFPPA